jgi:hypothetical protein
MMPCMGHMDVLSHFAGPGVGLTLATFSFAASGRGEFLAARVLFWFAVAFFSFPALWWQFTTPETWEYRVPSGAFAAMVVSQGFPWLWRCLKRRELADGDRSSTAP